MTSQTGSYHYFGCVSVAGAVVVYGGNAGIASGGPTA
jgi:hypothetical protein